LSLEIRNVSKKNITYLAVNCQLLETANWQAEMVLHRPSDHPFVGAASNVVGWRPEHALYSVLKKTTVPPDSTKRPSFVLAPGQEFTMPVEAPESYAGLKSGISETEPISSISACQGEIITVFFDDGTMWQYGHYHRAAEQPGRWTAITFDEWSKMSEMTSQPTKQDLAH
jgi:hypothetical protein